MLAPISWLKEFVDITLTPKELGDRLTEVGLGVENTTKTKNDVIFEFEVTPNRPDLLSILGIAREIAAIEGNKIKLNTYSIKAPLETTLPIKLNPDYKLFHRWSGVCIANISIKPSSQQIQDRLAKVGLRPINNIIDITNYVMYELGVPLHAFDYDQIKGHEMTVLLSKGGENFTSVDDKSYHLPKDAIIINDKERLIDLAGIKGGLNSGINDKTKNVFIHVTIDDPIHIRQTSQKLSLRSDASAIYERGTDKGETLRTLARATQLILEMSGGIVASEVFDLKKEKFKPWKLKLRINRLNKILGINIPEKNFLKILESLNLSPVVLNEVKNLSSKRRSFANAQDDNHGKTIQCIIPTYRNDLKIEEDLIEEVARLYGYNRFPKTIPSGQIPTAQIPYYKDYKTEEKAKNILKASGFSEIYTYSLMRESDLEKINIKPEQVLRVDNPVNRDFEYLRPTLKANLLKALSQNKANYTKINLFELGKVYLGKNLSETREVYYLSGITNDKNFFEIKGIIERLFGELGIKDDESKYIEIINEGIFFELNFSAVLKKEKLEKTFTSLPKYPPIIEDLAILASADIKIGDLISEIKRQSSLIQDVSLLDQFEETRTFHVVYQHRERNLTTEDVSKIRSKILKSLKEKFNAKLKELN